jgi:plastocyanin
MKGLRFLAASGSLLLLLSCGDNNSMPTQPAANATPTPMSSPAATPTPPPPAAGHSVNVGQGGNRFVDSQGGGTTTTIRAGDTVTWHFVAGPHSVTSGNCCTPDGGFDSSVRSSGDFSHTFSSAGSFPYFCTVHGSMMTGTVVVNP